MSKFKIGDKVITICNTPTTQEGWIGFITDTSDGFDWIAENDKGESEAFLESELGLLERRVEGVMHSVNVRVDVINSPKHYSVFEQVEAIQVIASSMTQDQFYGYCFGNILKYRLRAGGKDDVMQELGKADRYQGLYNENKHLCKVK